MIEIGKGVTELALIGAMGVKLFGPSFDYLGEELKNLTKTKLDNIKKISLNAGKKLGHKKLKECSVPPRVLKGILQDGSYSKDPFMVDYYGGILASSTSESSRDDRGVVFTALISRLSVYQIRTHYIFYNIFKILYDGDSRNVSQTTDAVRMKVYIPYSIYVIAMDFDEKENKQFSCLMPHIMSGLHKESLIGSAFFTYGNVDAMHEVDPSISEPGIIFYPSPLGAELFLWAHGMSELHVNNFILPKYTFEIEAEITIPEGYKKAP